ncbi:MAG: hypothetical protein K0U82_23105, partial [Planctomycetes bacterium]|nr:hypothetical protein [Planctomycetota bacterium]
GLDAGTYFLKVFGKAGPTGASDVAAPYTIDFSAPLNESLFPPDIYEINDLRAESTNLRIIEGAFTLDGANIHNPTDRDWYQFEITDSAESRHFVEVQFTDAFGNLDARLYNSVGRRVTSRSTTTDNEKLSLAGLSAGTYFIEVFASPDTDGGPNMYSLVFNTPSDTGDRFEINDSRGIATNLGVVERDARHEGLSIHTPSDSDFFRFELATPGRWQDEVIIEFTHATGDLDAELTNDLGDSVVFGTGVSDNEVISLQGLPAGVYYLEIYGFDAATNDYSIHWKTPSPDTLPPDWYEPPLPPGQTETPDDGYWLGLLEGMGSFPNADPMTGLIDPDAQPSIHNESDHDFWLFETQSAGSAEHFIDIAFENIHGDLDAQLHQFIPQTGWAIVGTASTSNNIESLSLDGLQGGLFCLEVLGFSGASNTYAINWNTPVYTPIGDDYEPNDVTPTDFTDLPQIIDVYPLTLHTINDVDNYLIELHSTGQPGDEVYIWNGIIDEGSELTTTLQSANTNSGEVIEGIELGWGESVISFEGLPAGQYVLTISAPANATPENWDPTGIYYGMYGILPSQPINKINDDIFEVNDTPETATVLRSTNSERISGLTIHNEADEDFFKFELTTAASPNDAVNVYFEHDLGDIDVELYPTESGNLEYFSNGYSSTDNEALSLAGLPAGEYYVKVYGYAGATNTYELQFNINTSSVTPDRFEVNDTLQTATQLRELSGFTMYEELGFHSSNDEDWFAFETVAASNQSNYVSALDHGENGGINLELFDSSGNSIAQDGEFLQFDNLPASQYYLRVTPSYQDQHTYDLVIDAPVLSQSPGDPNRGDWTIMVYITASDLYHFAQSDVNEIEKAVSELPGTVNVTVLWDQSEFGMTYATDSGRQAPW